MKKTLLIITVLLMTGMASQAQVALSNYTLQYYSPDNIDPLEAHLTFENNNQYPVDVNVARIVDILTPGHDELFCFGLYCYLVGTDSSAYATTIPADTIDDTFKPVIYPNGIDGYDQMHYNFYDENNKSDSVSITIGFGFNVTSVGETQEESYLKFNNLVNSFTVFGYRLPAQARNARVDIHNMLGSKLKSVELTEKQGMKVVSTAEMVNGIYLVSFVVNNKVNSSYRMVVNHSKGQ